MADYVDLNEIRQNMRHFLGRYENARGRADYLEVVLGVHTALEAALDSYLAPEQVDALSFVSKFEAVAPELAYTWDVRTLNRQRSDFAHPDLSYAIEQYQATAHDFVGLTLAAWPALFSGVPPEVFAPKEGPDDEALLQQASIALKAQQQRLDSAEERIQALNQQLNNGPGGVRQALPWRSLLLGLVLILPVALLTGFASQMARLPSPAWFGMAIAAVLALALALLALRYLWRFVQAAGPRRVFSLMALGLVLATLVAFPFTARGATFSVRSGASLTRVLQLAGATVGWPAAAMADAGATLARRIASPTASDVVHSVATATPKLVPVTPPPTELPPTRAPTPVPTPTEPPIEIGSQVVVATVGVPLMGRVDADAEAEILVRFDNGSELTVVDGPQQADGLTWWKVQGDLGAGWSAGQFLKLMEE